MREDGCIFCMLANGDIPTNAIYEDEDFKVIMDAEPVSAGHALIIPKEHYKNIYELPEDMAAKALPLAKKLAKKMTDALSCDGFNILQNNGEAAGQSVFHFHMHLIPRYKDAENNNTLLNFSHPVLSDEKKQEVFSKLK